MDDDELVSDEDIREAAYAGMVRCLNSRRVGTSLLRPTADPDACGWARHDYLVDHLGIDAVLTYYQELHRRADAFLSFFHGNVGDTKDFPLVIAGESWETMREFYDQLDHFGAILGLLNES